MTEAVLALGTNLGQRERRLDQGLAALEAQGVRLLTAGPRWHTRPIGGPPQPAYLDQVVRLVADLDPFGWLAAAQRAEAAAGRRRPVPWGPRTLDVDVLAVQDLEVDTPALRLPHPAVLQRPYLLRGLALVAPGWRHPGDGRTYLELARARGLAAPAAGGVRTADGRPGSGSGAGPPPPGG